jgi:purine-cytosine permease-like protein
MRREGWLRRLGPWVGIGTSPAVLMMGGGLGEGLAGPALLAAMAVGVAALTTLAAAQGALGQKGGQPLLALSAQVLGPGGRRVAGLAMLGMMIGWFGVNVGVGGTALGRLVGLPDRAGMALFALLTVAVVWRGVDALSRVALLAGAATVVLAAYGLAVALDGRPVGLGGEPADPIGFGAGVALVVGYGAAFALRTPDFTRDLARGRDVVFCALVGLAAPVAAFVLAGAVLRAATGTWDLADVLRDLGAPTLAYLFLAVGFSGSVMTNLYSGALSLTEVVPRAAHRAGLVAVALAGTALAAAHFSDQMLPYLTVMALAAPSLIAVCLVHARWGPARVPGAGLAAWGGGFAAGLTLHLAGSSLAFPAALGVAALVYGLIRRRPVGGRGRTVDRRAEA